MLNATIPLSQHPLLSSDLCDSIVDRVLNLHPYWTRRSRGRFHSLGAAAYLDAPEDHAGYLAAAGRTNPVLRDAFADVYSEIQTFLTDLLDDDVELTARLALPGFHIFELDGTATTEEVAARAHFDLQWMHAVPALVPIETVSFTVAIEQPTGGASMQIWPLRYQAVTGEGTVTSPTDYARETPSTRLAYDDGSIVIHDGHLLHAIGGSTAARPQGRRITLQGHGARWDDRWVLYW